MSGIKSALDPGKTQLAENMTLASESLSPADTANVPPIRVVLDNGTMPSSLAALIEQLQLKDVEILSSSLSVSTRTDVPQLTILVRSAVPRVGDTSAYAAMVTVQRPELAVAVQAAAGKLTLRAVGHAGVIALTKCPVDVRSLQALLQAGR